MAIERLLSGSIQERIEELLRPEDLIMEAARDLVKDEIKGYIRQKIDENPESKSGSYVNPLIVPTRPATSAEAAKPGATPAELS